MSVHITSAVLLRGPEGRLRYPLLVMSFEADDYGFWSSEKPQEDLASAMGVDVTTVQRGMKSLEGDGWIAVHRKVFGGRANVYFINLEKLGIGPKKMGHQSKEHRLWTEIQRLKGALDGGSKLSRNQGKIRFENPVNDEGVIETGDLFPDGKTPGGEAMDEDADERAQRNADLPTSASDAPDGELPSTPDKSPGDTPQNAEIHGRTPGGPDGKMPGGHYVLNRKDSSLVTTPLPPVGGTEGSGLPFEDLAFTDPGFADASAAAAAWVAHELGIAKRRTPEVLLHALRRRCRTQRGETLHAAARLAVASRREYMAMHECGDLRWGPWGVDKFFGEGNWESRASWPLRFPDRWKQGEATVGMQPAPGPQEARETARQAAIAAFVTDNAARVEAGGWVLAAEKMRALLTDKPDGAREDAALDAALQAIETEIGASLVAAATPEEMQAARAGVLARLGAQAARMPAPKLEDLIAAHTATWLLNRRGLPRLSLFFMP